MKYLIANWKSNFTPQEATHWIQTVSKNQTTHHPKLKTVICPAHIHLSLFKSKMPSQALGAQTISPYPDGTYTGATSARMLQKLVQFAILGHSERRQYFHETNQIVANQTIQALENKITPIISIREKNWRGQLAHFNPDQIKKIILMYEPPDAISDSSGQGEAAPVDTVLNEINHITEEYTPKAMLYGGSVKSHNLIDFISQPDIDGVVIGSASLDPHTWLELVSQANTFCLTATK